ncbi:MAG: hypothetical protein GXO86_10885 [Chlorobi bacterium]|nr:hypothetical protein [Chlorobiota bacterium]
MATTRRHSKKTGNNNLFIFLAIIIVLALISIIAAYFLTDKTASQDQTVTPIEGTWVSNYNGTMLTVNGLTITLELPAVDKSTIIKGKIAVEKNIVTFIYEDGPCNNIEGHYQYTFDVKGELFFKLIKDNCPSRQELMSASWFKM